MIDAGKSPNDRMRAARTRNAVIYGAVALCWVAYLIITFRQPAQQTNQLWDITPLQLNLIRLTVAVPYLLIWLAAFYGARRLDAYRSSLDEGQHRKAFGAISVGLHVLAVGLLTTTIVSSLRNFVGQQSDAVKGLTILLNYLYVLFPLVGFIKLRTGTLELLKEAHADPPTKARIAAILLAAAFGALLLFLVFTDAGRSMSETAGGRATYYLPDALIVLTLIVPFLISLPFGALATFNLYAFVRKSTAVIYEKTLPHLANGIMMIVAATVFLQLLLSLGSGRLLGLGLLNILLIVYAFLAMQAAGYLLVAKGAGRLAKLQKTLSKYQAEPVPAPPSVR